MSTELHLALVQPNANGVLDIGAIATVRYLADVTGVISNESWAEEQPIRAQGWDDLDRRAIFRLPHGGHYGITIVRPRGADIEREFLVATDEVRQEIITLAKSPHEYLAWQQFAHVFPPAGVRRLPSRSVPYFGFQGPSGVIELPDIPGLSPPPAPPKVSAADIPASIDAWDIVEKMSRSKLLEERLLRPLDWRPLVDPEIVAWLPALPDGVEGVRLTDALSQSPAGDPVDAKFPRWLWLQSVDHADLASAPWAWWGKTRAPDEEIRFSYDLLQRNPIDQGASGRFMISVQDRRWFSLLEFLASGRLSRAGQIFQDVRRLEGDDVMNAQRALEGKGKGPLPAVAGAIVLVAQESSNSWQEWDPWLENLSVRFPGIPDGPILLGYRRLQQATTRNQLESAFNAIAIGVGRGIPFFAASVRFAALALAQLGDDFDTAPLSRRIAYASARVDSGQPFTVIRL